MTLYKIKDWSTAYETHETRKLSALKWVPVPNKHDGLTFRQIGTERNAPTLFAGWILIVQIASKSDRERRGQLFRNGRPMEARDMALVTGFPESMFASALSYFSQVSVGWLVTEQYETELPLLPGEAGASPAKAGASPEKIPLNGIEGKGKEGKGKDALPAIPAPLAADAAFCSLWETWVNARMQGKKPKSGWTVLFSEQLAFLTQWDARGASESVKASIRNGWQGIFPPKKNNGDPWPTYTGTSAQKPQDGPTGWRDTLRSLYPDNTHDGAWGTLPESLRKMIEQAHHKTT